MLIIFYMNNYMFYEKKIEERNDKTFTKNFDIFLCKLEKPLADLNCMYTHIQTKTCEVNHIVKKINPKSGIW